MAERRRPRRRRTWILLLAAIAIGAWLVRSRRAVEPQPWDPPMPVPTTPPDAAEAIEPEPVPTEPPLAEMQPPALPAAVPTAEPRVVEPSGPELNGAGPAEPGPDPLFTPAPPDEPVTPPEPGPNPLSTEDPAGEPGPESAPEPAPEPAANPLFTPAPPEEPAKGVPALPDGSPPGPEFVIKGNAGSKLFHTEDSPYFRRTKAEVWFRTEEEAVAAGYTKWNRRRTKR